MNIFYYKSTIYFKIKYKKLLNKSNTFDYVAVLKLLHSDLIQHDHNYVFLKKNNITTV